MHSETASLCGVGRGNDCGDDVGTYASPHFPPPLPLPPGLQTNLKNFRPHRLGIHQKRTAERGAVNQPEKFPPTQARHIPKENCGERDREPIAIFCPILRLRCWGRSRKPHAPCAPHSPRCRRCREPFVKIT